MTAPIERFTQNDLLLYGLAGIYRLTDNVNIAGEVNGRVNTRGGTPPIGTESVGQFRLGTQVRASGLLRRRRRLRTDPPQPANGRHLRRHLPNAKHLYSGKIA